MADLLPCPFCSKTMMLRSALWPSEGDADAIIHADPTDCPMLGFSDGSADGSIIEKWNCSLSNEDDFPSDGSCVRCGSVPRNENGLCNTCLDEDAERLENTRPTPVAPVSPDATGKCGELVTVGKVSTVRESIAAFAGHTLSRQLKPGDLLCLRSQAEELLAAERAALPILKGTAFKSGDGWKDTTKEGDICFVWNRMHPAPYAPGQYPRVGKEHWSASIENYTFEPATLGEVSKLFADLKADNAALTARVKETEDCYLRLCEAIGVAATNAAPIDASEKLQALEAKLAAAEKALEPFANAADGRKSKSVTGSVCFSQHYLLAARAALGGKPS